MNSMSATRGAMSLFGLKETAEREEPPPLLGV
jgi:hypothetical protein